MGRRSCRVIGAHARRLERAPLRAGGGISLAAHTDAFGRPTRPVVTEPAATQPGALPDRWVIRAIPKGESRMLPKVVHHKQNGHTHTPTAQSRGDVIRAVHSVSAQGPSVTASLLRFASIVSSERAAALLADVTRHVDGVEMALTAALAKTRIDIDRGGFADVRAQLDGLRAHVERTARMVT